MRTYKLLNPIISNNEYDADNEFDAAKHYASVLNKLKIENPSKILSIQQTGGEITHYNIGGFIPNPNALPFIPGNVGGEEDEDEDEEDEDDIIHETKNDQYDEHGMLVNNDDVGEIDDEIANFMNELKLNDDYEEQKFPDNMPKLSVPAPKPVNPLASVPAPKPVNPLASVPAPKPVNPLASVPAPKPVNPFAQKQANPFAVKKGGSRLKISKNNYKLINPYIIGKLNTEYNAENGLEAAKKFWEELNPLTTNNVPQLFITFQDGGGNLLHYKINEKALSNGSRMADYTISEQKITLSKATQDFFEQGLTHIKNIEEKAKNYNQDGGRSHQRYLIDDSSDSDNDSDKYHGMYFDFSRYKRLSQPIAYWWYDPVIYNTTTIYTPTFNVPVTPYVQLWLPVL